MTIDQHHSAGRAASVAIAVPRDIARATSLAERAAVLLDNNAAAGSEIDELFVACRTLRLRNVEDYASELAHALSRLGVVGHRIVSWILGHADQRVDRSEWRKAWTTIDRMVAA